MFQFHDNHETKEQARKKIKEDLQSKNLENYKVQVNIQQSGGVTVGQSTSSILGDAYIWVQQYLIK